MLIVPLGAGFGGRMRTTSLAHHSHGSGSFHRDLSGVSSKDESIWVWGITGEQEWTPETKTGDMTFFLISMYLVIIHR
jgi:hypothetical protein